MGKDNERKPINRIKLSQGWRFTYSPSTRYIGMEHPKGGKQSICEMKHPFDMDEFGKLIIDFLNKEDGHEEDNKA